ncbi:hypothetical protein AGLY_007050 [Aphis glycines]|uniref:Uncharacterized protein n=1 Tax=Aphis glycines TaxID=307491 RepID=A0A6G0TQR5_APHGL|nr:hypothetical protein AGLY_007050 [Aphis glycines]
MYELISVKCFHVGISGTRQYRNHFKCLGPNSSAMGVQPLLGVWNSLWGPPALFLFVSVRRNIPKSNDIKYLITKIKYVHCNKRHVAHYERNRYECYFKVLSLYKNSQIEIKIVTGGYLAGSVSCTVYWEGLVYLREVYVDLLQRSYVTRSYLELVDSVLGCDRHNMWAPEIYEIKYYSI